MADKQSKLNFVPASVKRFSNKRKDPDLERSRELDRSQSYPRASDARQRDDDDFAVPVGNILGDLMNNQGEGGFSEEVADQPPPAANIGGGNIFDRREGRIFPSNALINSLRTTFPNSTGWQDKLNKGIISARSQEQERIYLKSKETRRNNLINKKGYGEWNTESRTKSDLSVINAAQILKDGAQIATIEFDQNNLIFFRIQNGGPASYSWLKLRKDRFGTSTFKLHPAWNVIINWNRFMNASRRLDKFILKGDTVDLMQQRRVNNKPINAVRRYLKAVKDNMDSNQAIDNALSVRVNKLQAQYDARKQLFAMFRGQ